MGFLGNLVAFFFAALTVSMLTAGGTEMGYCEEERAAPNCDEGLIDIVEHSVSYNPADNYCATFSEDVTTNPPDACNADAANAYAILAARCNNQNSCMFKVSDDLFGLSTQSCPQSANIISYLHFEYTCTSMTTLAPVTSSTTTEVTPAVHQQDTEEMTTSEVVALSSIQDSQLDGAVSQRVTKPTAPPQPTFSLCQEDNTEVRDCYIWQCIGGGWRNVSIAYNDSSCCYLWGACDITTATGNASSPSLVNISSSLAPQTSTGTLETAECPATVSSYREYNLTWRSTPAGLLRTVDCPGDTNVPPSVARRLCTNMGIWEETIHTSMCISPSLRNITTQVKSVTSEEDLSELTQELAEVTDTEQLTSSDISSVIDVLGDIGDQIVALEPTSVINITQDVLQVGDNLLNTLSQQDVTTPGAEPAPVDSMVVVAAVERVAIQAASTTNSSIHVQARSIELFVEVVNLVNDSLEYPITVESAGGLIEFPATNLAAEKEGSDYGKLVAVFYNNNNSAVWQGKGDLTVGTSVISVSTVDASSEGARRQLDKPFQYSLKHRHNSDTSLCVFWEETNASRWSTEGCKSVDVSDGTTRCECSHLTNFAVLLDTTGSTDDDSLALTIITYVGCIISIICLFLSWLTFQCLKNLSNDRNTIHKHLVFNLMLAELLFLVAISPYAPPLKIFCSVLAGVLHFLFLCVFSWTCLEGVQLYIMLIEVFEAERSRTLYYYLAGYGIPAIIVGVSAAVGYKGYGRDKVCWLNIDSGFIWSFAGPVAAVMLINIVMLSVAIYMMYNHAKMVANMKHKETSKMDNIRAWIKGAVVLVVLLGLTWIFGFMYVSNDTQVMAYIFTVLNSFQGLFIFIFHCAKNEKVQKEYKRYVRRAQWLPNCIRIRYGEHKGLSNVPSHSSSSSGYLSRYFMRRRKSSSDLTSGSVRLKKQISNLTSVNSNATDDQHYESKEPLTSQHKISINHGCSEQHSLVGNNNGPSSMC